MKQIIILILLFFLSLFISVDNTSAQSSACPNAVRITPCTPLGTTDSCGYNLCDCRYQNNSLGCAYNQDDICPDQATLTCPVNTTPINSCYDSLYQIKNCANSNQIGSDGKTYSYGSNIDCWRDRSQSICSGTESNTGCGYCQGWFYCGCPNGQPTDIACDKQRDTALGCGTFSLPCTTANSNCPTTYTCPALGTASGNTIYQGCQSSCLNVGYYTDGTGLTCAGTQQSGPVLMLLPKLKLHHLDKSGIISLLI